MQQNLDSLIVDFIQQHHVLTLATSVDNIPYVANCFYTYSMAQNQFIFTSDPNTRHGQESLANSTVAASIVLETKTIGKIQGLQLTGIVRMLSGAEAKRAKLLYLKQFPYAVLKLETMWSLDIHFAKMTDNKLGFGKKIKWTKEV